MEGSADVGGLPVTVGREARLPLRRGDEPGKHVERHDIAAARRTDARAVMVRDDLVRVKGER